jgi:hypothetical protein
MIDLIDVYHKLFGKVHIRDGDVIEMAEHGRSGGVSTGTAFKGTQDIPLKFIMDTSGGSTIYMGEANHGTATSVAKWRISQMVIGGGTITIYFADGNDLFDNEWDERDNLDYS